jgi:hypothetical protein
LYKDISFSFEPLCFLKIVGNGRGMSSGRMRTVFVSPDANAGAEDDAKFYESAAIAYDRMLAPVIII